MGGISGLPICQVSITVTQSLLSLILTCYRQTCFYIHTYIHTSIPILKWRDIYTIDTHSYLIPTNLPTYTHTCTHAHPSSEVTRNAHTCNSIADDKHTQPLLNHCYSYLLALNLSHGALVLGGGEEADVCKLTNWMVGQEGWEREYSIT